MKAVNRKLLCGTLAGAMLLSFAGCSASGRQDSRVKIEDDPKAKAAFDYDEVRKIEYAEDDYSTAYQKYAFDIMAKAASFEDDDTNMMISPASVMFAMDLCAAGANGDTLDQINGLFADSGDPLAQQAYASDMIKKFGDAENTEFTCVNAIWNNSNVLGNKISSDYVDYVEDAFNAEINAAPFGDETADEINAWVNDSTDGMVDSIVDDIDPNTAAVLVNAIAFDSVWLEPYEDDQVKNSKFTLLSGETESAKFLCNVEWRYFESDKATGFMKNYEDGYAFIAILPKDDTISANEFLAGFTGEDYIKFINSMETFTYDVKTKLPVFEYDYETEMSEILIDMGVEDAFIPGVADFSGISSENALYISKVLHKTHIELDQYGTTAAAVTEIELSDGGCEDAPEYKEVYCDRPFAYVIVDTDTMNPIFIGTVNSVG